MNLKFSLLSAWTCDLQYTCLLITIILQVIILSKKNYKGTYPFIVCMLRFLFLQLVEWWTLRHQCFDFKSFIFDFSEVSKAEPEQLFQCKWIHTNLTVVPVLDACGLFPHASKEMSRFVKHCKKSSTLKYSECRLLKYTGCKRNLLMWTPNAELIYICDHVKITSMNRTLLAW